MAEEPERIEISVPPGTLYVRHARCPKGCDLMDPGVPIHGHPSVHLVYRSAGEEGHIRLDPRYGGYDNLADKVLRQGQVVEFFCPGCGVSLQSSEERCSVCSTPMFVLHLPHGGFVEGCQRNACLHHKLHLVSGEEGMQRLFDRLVTDNYL